MTINISAMLNIKLMLLRYRINTFIIPSDRTRLISVPKIVINSSNFRNHKNMYPKSGIVNTIGIHDYRVNCF